MTQVTGPLFDEFGGLLANTVCVVQAVDGIIGQNFGGRTQRGRTVVTNGSGVFDADIEPGAYFLFVIVPSEGSASVTAKVTGRITVLSDGPQTLQSALDSDVGDITANTLQLAQDAAAAAAASAASIDTERLVYNDELAEIEVATGAIAKVLDLRNNSDVELAFTNTATARKWSIQHRGDELRIASDEIAGPEFVMDGAGNAEFTGIVTADGTITPEMPQYHGAVADGVTDDSAAIAAWLNYIIDNDLTGYAPAGDYLLNSIYTKVLSGTRRFQIRGAGMGATRFIVPASNTDGAFDINARSSRAHEAGFFDFTIRVMDNTEKGLHFYQLEGGRQTLQNVLCHRVRIECSDQDAGYCERPFSFVGTWRPDMNGIVYVGANQGTDRSDTSPWYDTIVAVDLDSCYDPRIGNYYIWGANTAIRNRSYLGAITGVAASPTSGKVRVTVSNGPHPFSTGFEVTIAGTTDYNGTLQEVTRISDTEFDVDGTFTSTQTGTAFTTREPEAVMFHGCGVGNQVKTFFVGTRYGGREPFFLVSGNHHINYRDFGWFIDGFRLVKLDGLNMYNEDTGNEGSNPRDIILKNAAEYIITNSHFHFAGNDNRIGIFVEADTAGEGDEGIINNCIFSGKFDEAIRLANGVTGCVVGPNNYSGTIGVNVNSVVPGANVTGEWVSNSNGRYLKQADGTVTMQHKTSASIAVNTASGAYNFRSDLLSWTFPFADCIEPPTVQITPNGVPTAAGSTAITGTPSSTSVSYYLLNVTSLTAATRGADLTAHGRWR